MTEKQEFPPEEEGTPVIGPMTGYDLFLAHRYGSPRPEFRPCADCRTPITCEESEEDRCP